MKAKVCLLDSHQSMIDSLDGDTNQKLESCVGVFLKGFPVKKPGAIPVRRSCPAPVETPAGSGVTYLPEMKSISISSRISRFNDENSRSRLELRDSMMKNLDLVSKHEIQ